MMKLFSWVAVAVILGAPAIAQTDGGLVTPGDTNAGVAPTMTAPATGAPTDEDPAVELLFWESIKDSDNPDLFLAYMQRYPNGVFRVIAEENLKAIYSGGADDVMEDDTGMVEDDEPVVQPAPTAKPAPRAVNNHPVRTALQRELRRLGCYRGAIDGIWGPGSRAAARRFNKATSGANISVNRAGSRALSILRSYNRRVCY